jgi:uncharacterized protein
MGLKYLLFGLAIWGIYLILKHFLRTQNRQQAASREVKTVDSVKCAYCGLHLPRNEALWSEGRYYCCKAHLKAADEDSDS